MTAFWIVIAGLLVLVSLALVVPLWRGEGKQSISRSALNKQLYRQRLLEIGEEREQGSWLRSPTRWSSCNEASWMIFPMWSRPPAVARV